MKHGKLPTIVPSLFFSHRNLTFLSQSEQSFPPTLSYLSRLTAASIASALQLFISSENPKHGQKIHTHVIKTGFKSDTNISIKILILYLKCGCLKFARQMFDELAKRTLSSYNYMIGGYLKHGQVQESLSLARRLIFSGEKPDGFTFSMILKASTGATNDMLPRSLGRAVHAQILKCDVEPDDVLYTGLVDSYVKEGRVECARTVFDMMLEKNVVCSTSMISGYMNQGSAEDAEDIFYKTVEKDLVVYNAMIEGYSKSFETARKALKIYIDMQRNHFQPNMSTFSSVIGACSVLSAFEAGQQVQGQLMKTEVFTNVKIGSSLLDMYAKCGRIEEARRVFDHMPEKNVFSWTSMLDGYGKNGNYSEALTLFQMMPEYGVEPNDITFLGALSACAHAGLVAKGCEVFESMEKDHRMKPKMEHYACMVDLFGRAGSLYQAWEFVMRMPKKPNSDVWAALLSSSKLHGNIEMANIAAKELFKLNAASRPGAYVALSNTLAAAGKWDNVSELRGVMKIRGVLKDTACSWVGSDGAL
ncbi:pentatricopeptide repeat-containing protein At1g28690, mitochondrial isoform X1 [Carica papaya]|uniref:pentatricopeptide repeat-containing protein At1g28690, mitochondrial isoform X1 n=1 Tax=Carica papaya TaxID=3649 RepID=UPI000B8C985D|nr:pentatricopeptide repeat-containing protein At1g28690, mitochondrial isoform X1 [Carica papaya]